MENLNQRELLRDLSICGCSLAEERATAYAFEGAHDPTATRYFVLEQMFAHFAFSGDSHLLDVGCGAGRALAYFAEAGFPGRATGVELDPSLARRARGWSARFPQINVVQGNVLDMPLAQFTDFYLFNPFDSSVLLKFIEKLEAEAAGPVTLVHMSDNGETYYYMGRDRWRLRAEGWIQQHEGVAVFGCPQHWSVWRME